MTCGTVPAVKPVSDPDKRLPAHKMPMAMAHDVLLDCVTSADLMQKAIYAAQPESEVERLRETARSQFEAYLDLMGEAATHVRALKP